MKILIDMNLSPEWRETFGVHGFEAKHWSEIGDPKAKDREILACSCPEIGFSPGEFRSIEGK